MLFLTSTWTNARQHAAIALTVFFVVAQFLAGFHLAVEEHVTCEHGKTVHAKHLRAGIAAPAPLAPGNTVKIAPNAPDKLEAHDHCDVSLLENTTFELHAVVHVEFAAWSSTQVEPVVVLGQAWWSARPQYEIAPKQSPPFSAV